MLDWIVWLKPYGLDKLIEASAPQAIRNHYQFVEEMVTKRLATERERETQGKPVEREDMRKLQHPL